MAAESQHRRSIGAVQRPGFNPNAFVGGISAPVLALAQRKRRAALLDRAIQARYPPGSTWKLAVAAMGLKRGIVGPRSHMPIPCRGGLQYGNRFLPLLGRTRATAISR